MGRDGQTVQNIDGCQVLTPGLFAMIPALEDFTTRWGSRKGRLAFWCLETETGIDLAVDGLPDPEGQDLAQLAQWANAHSLARLVIGAEVVMQSAPPRLTFGSAAVVPPPRAFAQATVAGELALQSAVAEAVGDAKHVVDLFAGFGTLSLPIGGQAKVQAHELARDLSDAHQMAAKQSQGLKPVTATPRDLFRNPLLAEDLNKFDAAILDPARAGAQEQCNHLATSDVPNIAMISCNPLTFARDVGVLQAEGYRLDWFDVIDQFRWSPHIEIAAALTR